MHDPSPQRASGFVQRMDFVLDTIALMLRVLTGIALVILTVIFGWLVYGRYVLNSTPTWVEQVALLLVMTIAFLGAAVGVHEHTHLSVSLFRKWVPEKVRLAMVLVSDVLLAGFGALMFWYGWQLTTFKWGSQIPLIHVPEGLRSLPLTLGGGLIMIFTLAHILRLFLGQDTRRDEIG
ncbi:TRAP transporter small permease [Rhodobacteraceae bacterium]|nr:TRAP transporter small permease [Paracoccaceae bacterium]